MKAGKVSKGKENGRTNKITMETRNVGILSMTRKGITRKVKVVVIVVRRYSTRNVKILRFLKNLTHLLRNKLVGD